MKKGHPLALSSLRGARSSEVREAGNLLRSLTEPDGYALFALDVLGLDPQHRIRCVAPPMTLAEFQDALDARMDNLPDPR